MANILVVEDTPANMKLAKVILENAGYTVLPARNALDGIALARAVKPDLILMDIQLPGMDGLAATRQLKDDPVTASIPIIAMTAFAMQGDEEKMRAAGCDGYLAKPISRQALVVAVADGLTKDINIKGVTQGKE